jgi:hypothetical protein
MKFNKSLLAASMLAISGQATAGGFYFDLAAVGLGDYYVGQPMASFVGEDSDTITDVSTGFTTSDATLTSVYWDTDGSGDINTGDAVTDDVSGLTVIELFGLSSGVDSEFHGDGVGTTWQLSIDWSFSGVSFVGDLAGTGEELYAAAFDQGSALMWLTNLTTNVDYDVLSMDMVGFANNLITDDDDNVTGVIDVEWNVDEVYLDDFIYTASGEDFFELVNTDEETVAFTASTEITGLGNVPTYTGTGTYGNDNNVDYYVRTTEGQSTDWNLVPEPASLGIFGATLLALAGFRRKSL